MSRPIKFRGKRLDNGELIYGLPSYNGFNGEISEIEAIETDEIGQVDEYRFNEVDPETVGQFTGSMDDRPEGEQIEIFEGDLVKATNKSGWTREFQIIWNEDRAGFMVWCFSQSDISFELSCDSIIDYHVIVIGKSYPNPELLEAKK